MATSTRRVGWIALAVLTSGSCAKTASKPAAAAKVENAHPEGTVPTVTLSDDAIKRLGLEVAEVQMRAVSAIHTVGGEVMAPPGWAIAVSAPVAGIIARGSPLPPVGSAVAAGAVLLRMIPIGSQSDAVRSREDLEVARARATSARAEAERIRALHKDGLASTRDLEQAEAALQAAEATLRATEARLGALEGGGAAGGVPAVAIRAPSDGRVTEVHVAAGETVGAGAPLIGLLRDGRLWIKVPLFAGDLARIARSEPAAVRSLRLADTDRAPLARPVAGPPSANAANASVDLYYEMIGAGAVLQPGERVEIALPLKESEGPQLVVPWSAIVRDAQGGTWVYERTTPNTFSRRPVIVRGLVGDWAILDRGPPAGTVVVSVAVAELFGTEFGTGK